MKKINRKVDEMEYWKVDECHIDEKSYSSNIPSWWNNPEITARWDIRKMTKWQVDGTAGQWNRKLTKQQVDET